MAKLKLIKGCSYNGIVSATKTKPIVDVTDKEAEALIATGYFEPCNSDVSIDVDVKTDSTAPDYEALSKMTKAELLLYAKSNNIDTAACKSKADILQAISVTNGGSYTMMELQQEKH